MLCGSGPGVSCRLDGVDAFDHDRKSQSQLFGGERVPGDVSGGPGRVSYTAADQRLFDGIDPHEGDLVTLRKRPRDRRLAGGRQTTDHDERCAGRWLGVVSGIHHPRNVRGVVDLRELAPYSAQFEIANSRASNARSSAADSIRAVARLGAVSTATIGTANASRPRTKTGKRNENTSSPCGAGAAAS